MASRDKHQLGLGPMPLGNSEQSSSVLRNSQQESSSQSVLGNSQQHARALRQSEQFAAEVLAAAFTEAGLESKEIAYLCGVSTSLVEKWCDADQRGCPSLIQMLMLPPAFHIALHRQLNKRLGLGRAALVRLLDAAGDLALVVGE